MSLTTFCGVKNSHWQCLADSLDEYFEVPSIQQKVVALCHDCKDAGPREAEAISTKIVQSIESCLREGTSYSLLQTISHFIPSLCPGPNAAATDDLMPIHAVRNKLKVVACLGT